MNNQQKNNASPIPINIQEIKAPLKIEQSTTTPPIKHRKINYTIIFYLLIIILLTIVAITNFFLLQQNHQLKNDLNTINYQVTTVLPQQINFDCQATAPLPQNCR